VVVDRPHGDDEARSDLGVRQALADQPKDLHLTAGEPGRIGPVSGCGPRGTLAQTHRAKPPAHQGRSGPRTQIVEHRQRLERRLQLVRPGQFECPLVRPASATSHSPRTASRLYR
jgi:hypothetical protein